jgi:hypothetical protein
VATKKEIGRTHLNRKEMQAWLTEEIRDVLKECDLRLRDATGFAIGYITGDLTVQQAHERLNRYEERWGDPLAGVYASSHKSDESILSAIDKRRARQKALSHVELLAQRGSHGPDTEHGRGR